MTAHEEAVRDTVVRIVTSCAPTRAQDVIPTSELRVDLGYDSLALMELTAHLEQTLDVEEVPEDEVVEAETVEEVQELVLRLLRVGGVP